MRILRHTFLYGCLLLSLLAVGQSGTVGIIEIFGNRHVSKDTILRLLPVKEGDSIANEAMFDSIFAAIQHIPGTKSGRVDAVCCDEQGKLILYIGIVENDSAILKWREPPGEDISLPEKMMNDYGKFFQVLVEGINLGQSGDDHSEGHSLVQYAPARAIQENFKTYALQLELLRRVLAFSKYEEHRAAGAQIIAYAPDKSTIIKDLIAAAEDNDETVRNNAVRALGVIANYALVHPAANLKIPADPFIKMVNSNVWYDRKKATSLLYYLTASRDPVLLNELKNRALNSLAEMAQWRNIGHSSGSYAILARIAGRFEATISNDINERNFARKVPGLLETIRNSKATKH